MTVFGDSERKYKEKIKEWKFEKYLSGTNMDFIAALDETRARIQGKRTIFYNGNIKISPRRIDTFKKRRKQGLDKTDALAAGKERTAMWNSQS